MTQQRIGERENSCCEGLPQGLPPHPKPDIIGPNTSRVRTGKVPQYSSQVLRRICAGNTMLAPKSGSAC